MNEWGALALIFAVLALVFLLLGVIAATSEWLVEARDARRRNQAHRP